MGSPHPRQCCHSPRWRNQSNFLGWLQLWSDVVCGIAFLRHKGIVDLANHKLLRALHAAVAAKGQRTPAAVRFHKETQLQEVAGRAVIHEDFLGQTLAETPVLLGKSSLTIETGR